MQYAMRYKDVQVSMRLEVFHTSDPTRYVHAKITCEAVQLGDSGFGDVGRDHLMIKMSQIEGIATFPATQLHNHALRAESWCYLEDFGTGTTHTRYVGFGVARVPPEW
ncbi:hypothetical protein XI08_10845 [Bradyrhizobium sp. CCBAU 11361]|nr:hypothetical protein [Bradyrhizobium sp. CCBAU 11361]